MQNINISKKVNISNFSFLAAALMCKVICVCILLIQVMGLLGSTDTSYRWVRVLDSMSFVLLLVACSLQLYKWIMIILRVQWFGSGNATPELYMRKLTISRITYIVMASLISALNLVLIFCETFKHGWYFKMTQAVTTFIMVSTSSQIINFLVVGSLVIRKLHVYFDSNYDK